MCFWLCRGGHCPPAEPSGNDAVPGSMTSIAPYGLYVNAVARGVEDAAPYRDGCLLFQCKQQLPQYLAGRSGRNAALVEHGGQLVDVRADDVCLCHGADRL